MTTAPPALPYIVRWAYLADEKLVIETERFRTEDEAKVFASQCNERAGVAVVFAPEESK